MEYWSTMDFDTAIEQAIRERKEFENWLMKQYTKEDMSRNSFGS